MKWIDRTLQEPTPEHECILICSLDCLSYHIAYYNQDIANWVESEFCWKDGDHYKSSTPLRFKYWCKIDPPWIEK